MIHRESIPGFRRGSWLPCYQAQLRTADSYGVSDERIHFAQRIDERAFSRSRRGYDKAEVKSYLEDLEQAFRELEGHSRRLSQKVAELEQEVSKARATEKVSVDNAMMAVFDAKDRILERARRKADAIEEDARLEAGRIRQAAIAEAGDAGASGEIAAARAQANEIIAEARREAGQLRQESAAASNDGAEADLADMAERVRRAHDDSTVARAELDEARKRIAELENVAPGREFEQSGQKMAELEEAASAASADAARLQQDLAKAQDDLEAVRREAVAAETARSRLQDSLEAAVAELNEAKVRINQLADSDRLRREAESRLADAETRAAEAAAAATASQAESAAGQSFRTDPAETTARDVEQAEFAGTMAAFEARILGTLAARENLDLIAEISRAVVGVLPELSVGAEHADARAEAERILVAAREEAEDIKVEAQEQADQRAAKVIARARQEADQVRQTVAMLTAQAEDARSAALRSKLEAEDLAEAQKAMSEARNQIIATAERRAEEIAHDAERAAADLRTEAAAVLEEALTEAERIVATAVGQAGEKKAGAASAAEADAEPEPASELELEQESTAEPDSPEPQQAGTGDELAGLPADSEHDLAADHKVHRERERLDAPESEPAARQSEPAAQQAEAVPPAATQEGGVVDSAVFFGTAGAGAEAGVPGPEIDVVEPPGAGETEDAVDDFSPGVELDDTLDTHDAASVEDRVEGDDDGHEEDSTHLQAALVEEPGTGVSADDAVAEPDEAELETALVAEEDVADDLSEGPGPRVAWPSPVDLGEEPEEGSGGGSKQSRYRSRSAQLPRLGRQAKSDMTTMENLRKKSRSSGDD